jgi:hypothetical protein
MISAPNRSPTRDVCGLKPAEGEEVSVWAARALVRAALRDSAEPRAR